MGALAAGEYLQILDVSPTGAVNPGTSVSFIASASGFIDPRYSVTDSFSASGATTGSIDQVGYFTWTPGIYDAGRHTLTVSVSDPYDHTASTTVDVLVAGNSILTTNISPGPVVAARRLFTFSVVAPGFISPNFTIYDSYSRSSASSNNINAQGSFMWAPTVDELGAHRLIIVASDTAGHNAQTTVDVTVVSPTASIDSISPGTGVAVGTSLSFLTRTTLSSPTWSVEDSFRGTSSIPASAISSSGRFSWVPVAADLGLHTLTVTATDVYGNTASTSLMVAVVSGSVVPTSATTPAAAVGMSTSASSTPAVERIEKYLFTSNLSVGSRGASVQELQKRLTALGFFSGPVSGYFGPLTAASVKKFQAAHGLPQVGNVGPLTRAVLNR